MKDELGTRIKAYEAVSNPLLTPNSPLFIRVDGKAFHTFTKHCDRPFDFNLTSAMVEAAKMTAFYMQGFKLAYVQSDECTFCLTDYDRLETQGWFNYELNKIVSVTASMFTGYFNKYYDVTSDLAFFDARAFTVPIDDAPNVFVWRQKDWRRNSIQMLAQSVFSHNELQDRRNEDVIKMLSEAGHSWDDLALSYKYGTFIDRELREDYAYKNYYDIAKLIGVD